jgi:hypothetical protein
MFRSRFRAANAPPAPGRDPHGRQDRHLPRLCWALPDDRPEKTEIRRDGGSTILFVARCTFAAGPASPAGDKTE